MISFCKENKCIPDNTAEHEKSETGKRTKTELFQLNLSKFKKPTKLRASGITGQV